MCFERSGAVGEAQTVMDIANENDLYVPRGNLG